MKIVTGCHNEEWRFEPLSVECEPKINSNLKSTEAFYPIELNYKLVKYKLNDKAQNGSEEWDRKSIGNKKGKVVILFNPKNQTYELPVGFEKISTNTNKLWEYFSNLAASKQKQVNSNQIDLTDFVKCHVLGVVECESKEDFLQNMTLLQKRSVKQEIVRRDEIAKEGGEDYHSKDVTILLQNATAFGYPINAIHIIRGYEFGATKVEFADFQSLAEVSKLFPLPEHKNKEKGYFLAVYDFDENGKPSPKVKTIYDKEGKPLPRLSVMGGGCYGGLIFNPKALTISDEGGC